MTVKTFVVQSDAAPLARLLRTYVEGLLSQLRQEGHYVEVHIFPTRNAMKTALQRELEQLEIPSSLVVPDFATFHEAFAGYPRIWISSEDADLRSPISRARLQHEVGHAVLHWEISAYLLDVPPSLKALARAGRMTHGDASWISYMISIGVKDFAVSRLLDRSGIHEDQEAFYLQELGRAEAANEGLFTALNELKVVMGAHPFRRNPGVNAALGDAVRRLGGLTDVAREILLCLDGSRDADLQETIELVSRTIARGMGA